MWFLMLGVVLAFGILVCFLFGLGVAKMSAVCSRGEEESELYLLSKKRDADNNQGA